MRRRKPHWNARHGGSINRKLIPEYAAYLSAKQRCVNSHHPQFKNYGGRGIKFRFKSFEQFLAEIGYKPSQKLWLDRINNDGHYEVGNVRWTTVSESIKNQRKTERQLRASRKNIALINKRIKTWIVRDAKTGQFRSASSVS